jgi:hypothetical protein
MRKTAD